MRLSFQGARKVHGATFEAEWPRFDDMSIIFDVERKPESKPVVEDRPKTLPNRTPRPPQSSPQRKAPVGRPIYRHANRRRSRGSQNNSPRPIGWLEETALADQRISRALDNNYHQNHKILNMRSAGGAADARSGSQAQASAGEAEKTKYRGGLRPCASSTCSDIRFLH